MHKRTLKRHIKNKHASIADQAQKELKLTCHDCGVRYSRQDALDRHIRTQVCERRKKGMAQVH
ncbi:hypothetical protein BX666DRAFT_1905499 [Dichotomocladium elegans]|nr:hypothetical protein BX666DRAFT_1905499 [Dichotomocladium elegans]